MNGATKWNTGIIRILSTTLEIYPTKASRLPMETLSKSYFNTTCHELLDSFWRKITSTNSNISNMSWLLRKKSNMELENSPPLNTTKSFELIWTITKPWFFFLSSRSISGSVTLTFTPPLFCSASILPPANQWESPGCPGHLAENVAHAWAPSKHQRPETEWHGAPCQSHVKWPKIHGALLGVSNKFPPWEKENYRLKSDFKNGICDRSMEGMSLFFVHNERIIFMSKPKKDPYMVSTNICLVFVDNF